jgi:phage-related protein
MQLIRVIEQISGVSLPFPYEPNLIQMTETINDIPISNLAHHLKRTQPSSAVELSGHIHLGVWSSTLNPVINLKQKKALFEDSSYLPLAIDEKRKL